MFKTQLGLISLKLISLKSKSYIFLLPLISALPSPLLYH